MEAHISELLQAAGIATIKIEIHHFMVAGMLGIDIKEALEVVELFEEEIYDGVLDRLPEIITDVMDEFRDEREEQVRKIREGFTLVSNDNDN